LKPNPDFSRTYWQKAASSGITEFPHSSLRPERKRLSL
jgi:hypothetical protein